MEKIKIGLLCAIALYLATATIGFSQASPSPKLNEGLWLIPRMSGQVTLDGLSNEEAWQAISPLPLTGIFPIFGNPPSEKTEILVGHDESYIYVAARLYDREPGKMQSPSKQRDYPDTNSSFHAVKYNSIGGFL